MKQVRWGLLSTANINRRLIPAIRAARRGQLVAVASRTQAGADAYARHWQIPQAFGSYAAMLQSDAIDAVYISLPNHLHAEWTIAALEQGKHVLCEKPFALTLAEVDRMAATAAASGKVLAEAFMYRHHPQTKRAGDWARQGRLGDLILIRASFNFAMSSRDNVRLAPAYGGGSLWDVGVYPVSLAQFITGQTPNWVMGDQWVGPTGVDESFAGLMQYGAANSGLTAQISCSFRSPWHTWAEIQGTEGRLSLNRPFVGLDDNPQLIFHPATGPAEVIPIAEQSLYAGEVTDMHDAILEGKPPYISLAETRDHVRTVLALYESARTGQVARLDGPAA
jgi:D-xylose 1-dehydrogenase (NADP+, D-xylono-1,5-lactone-forming)